MTDNTNILSYDSKQLHEHIKKSLLDLIELTFIPGSECLLIVRHKKNNTFTIAPSKDDEDIVLALLELSKVYYIDHIQSNVPIEVTNDKPESTH